jgi:hypothetical protein
MDGVAHLEVILGAAGFGTATSRETPLKELTPVSRAWRRGREAQRVEPEI